MSTLERATALLTNAGSPDGLSAILAELGFATPLALDAKTRSALGLPEIVRAARIAKGAGDLRALALDLAANAESRRSLTAVASALARAAPQFLWLVMSVQAESDEVAIICWTSRQSRPRIASLVCNRSRLFESDAETLCALSSARSDSDLLTHSRWLDILGREAITRRFFHALQASVGEIADSLGGRINAGERTELALLLVSRLIFLSFLETKGWLDADFGFLANGFSRCIAAGGNYQKTVLDPLFFGTLNTPARCRSHRARSFGRIPFLNGGLFARSHLEKRRRGFVFSDESVGNAYGSLLSRYRFSAREDSAIWSEASIDPEMLGKAFEALMIADERKSSGAFFTPQSLVEDVVSQALDGMAPRFSELDELRSIRVLDPACGSGAFLVHVLERIAGLRVDAGERSSIADIRRSVLTTSIFGVDSNPIAVWLCELRLWLSIVIESANGDPMKVVPLPNLDRTIRIGDSLSGGAFIDAMVLPKRNSLAALRSRYVRASGPRKRTLATAMDRAERNAAIEVLRRERARFTSMRKEVLIAARALDLFGNRHRPDRETRLRLANIRSRLKDLSRREKLLHEGHALPFSFAAQFSDVAATEGFSLIVGNPPWVRVHKIAESSRAAFRQNFASYRNAAWQSGAAAAGAGRGFSAQIDMSALFVERSCDLLRPGATMALLVPAKLWRSLAGGGVRQLLQERTDLVALEDMTEATSQFEAAVYPSLLVARKKIGGFRATTIAHERLAEPVHTVQAAVRFPDRVIKWRCAPGALPFDSTCGSPWVLLPPKVRHAFELLRESGAPFASTQFGRPSLGVKTGCNAAFVVRVAGVEKDLAMISTDARNGSIELEMLRPLVRGETLSAWEMTGPREYLVWTHSDDNRPRKEIPPFARQWLLPFRDQLAGRADLRGRLPWWSVFRTESANHHSARVIWADFGLRPRAIVVEPGDRVVPLNTCYSTACDGFDDAYALVALLNGSLAAAWLNVLAEPARGSYRRYLGWTMSLLPLPTDWPRARAILAPLGQRGMSGDVPTDADLLAAALESYGLTAENIQPLLSWMDGGCD
ncbi:MAG: Eco57I restriction-modification methylase domain-containing protein [Gemmatimonadaceae bacterium]